MKHLLRAVMPCALGLTAWVGLTPALSAAAATTTLTYVWAGGGPPESQTLPTGKNQFLNEAIFAIPAGATSVDIAVKDANLAHTGDRWAFQASSTLIATPPIVVGGGGVGGVVVTQESTVAGADFCDSVVNVPVPQGADLFVVEIAPLTNSGGCGAPTGATTGQLMVTFN